MGNKKNGEKRGDKRNFLKITRNQLIIRLPKAGILTGTNV